MDPTVAELGRALLGDTWVVESLPRALELWSAGGAARQLVTLEGDRVEPTGVVVGGSPEALDSALLQQKREIRELEAVAQELQTGFEDARARHLAVVESLRAVQVLRAEVEDARAAAQRDHGAATAAAAHVERQRVAAAERVARAGDDWARLEVVHDQRVAEHAAAAEASLAAAAALPEAARARAIAQDRVTEQAGARDAAVEVLTQARVAWAQWQQRNEALRSTADRFARQLASERERAAKLLAAVERNDQEIARLEATSAEATLERAELLASSREATTAVHDARERYEAMRQRIDEIDLAVRNLRGSLEAERDRLQEVELGLQQNALERRHLELDARERFDLHLDEVIVDYHDRPLAGERELERQAELRRTIARMGEVNLTAIGEYDEVSQRYDYLVRQRDDLEAALAQLEEAIDTINKTTRQRFQDTFDLVNERFQQVFPRLFAGGRAELRLTDPGNLLETGVEIVAQPPGKQLRNLELLSGGEKALTATSLVFAVFLIKPSPFCIMDEVDAPLDDANVGRFCALVRDLSERTQFLVITHNKITMESADRLYGVTMEQRGVSKLVSVNLRRAVELAYD
jgi:chromosome segregation protein